MSINFNLAIGKGLIFHRLEFSDDVIWGQIKTKQLTPPEESVHNTKNISCLGCFFRIIIFPI